MKGNVDLNFNNKFFKQQEGSLDFKEKNYGFNIRQNDLVECKCNSYVSNSTISYKIKLLFF